MSIELSEFMKDKPVLIWVLILAAFVAVKIIVPLIKPFDFPLNHFSQLKKSKNEIKKLKWAKKCTDDDELKEAIGRELTLKTLTYLQDINKRKFSSSKALRSNLMFISLFQLLYFILFIVLVKYLGFLNIINKSIEKNIISTMGLYFYISITVSLVFYTICYQSKGVIDRFCDIEIARNNYHYKKIERKYFVTPNFSKKPRKQKLFTSKLKSILPKSLLSNINRFYKKKIMLTNKNHAAIKSIAFGTGFTLFLFTASLLYYLLCFKIF